MQKIVGNRDTEICVDTCLKLNIKVVYARLNIFVLDKRSKFTILVEVKNNWPKSFKAVKTKKFTSISCLLARFYKRINAQ